MKKISDELGTPVYLKTGENEPWPKDKMFYLLTSSGLFLCRNHIWFQSCSPAPEGRGPSDLAAQEPEIELTYPVLPKAMVEKAVGFFRHVYDKDHSESALIIVFNKQTGQLEFICPDQEVSFGSVDYDSQKEIPKLAAHLTLVGDFHSHCDFAPSPSYTDEKDELNRPGMHLIAGYLKDPKPKFHCVVVADGTRFTVLNHAKVMEPFESSEGVAVPKEWLAKVKKKYADTSYSQYDGGMGYTGGGSWFKRKPSKEDKEKIVRMLEGFLSYTECPSMITIRSRLFSGTNNCTYNYCEKRANDFIKEWPKLKAKYDQQHPPKQTTVAPATETMFG